MYLFIFESIGTSELILIGAVALIVFGPRKLPQMARTLGKAMADFKNTTNEFKSTWEREANFDGQDQSNQLITASSVSRDQSIALSETQENTKLPEIKEIDASKFNMSPASETPSTNKIEHKIAAPAEKQNWL